MSSAATPKRTRDAGQNREGWRRGLAPAAAAVARVAAPLLKKRGLAEARIITDWRAIVGASIAERSAPERLLRGRAAQGVGSESGGTLRLRVAGAWALEFQHMAPALIARINGYFGYPAVGRIQFIQAPLPAAKRAPAPPAPLTPAAEARLAAITANIADPELRERVMALGRALERRAARVSKVGSAARKPV